MKTKLYILYKWWNLKEIRIKINTINMILYLFYIIVYMLELAWAKNNVTFIFVFLGHYSCYNKAKPLINKCRTLSHWRRNVKYGPSISLSMGMFFFIQDHLLLQQVNEEIPIWDARVLQDHGGRPGPPRLEII